MSERVGEPVSMDLRTAMRPSVLELPLASELSLAPLIAFWNDVLARKDSVKGAMGRVVQERLREAPELAQPIRDLAVLDRHRDLVDTMMSAVFPPVFWDHDYGAALLPFQLRAFYATPSFERTLLDRDGMVKVRINVDPETVASVRLLYAYRLILRRLYDIELAIEYPLIFTTADPVIGLERHFKMHFDWRFVEAEPVGAPVALSEEARGRLASQVTDLDVLRGLLPLQAFRFRGFSVLTAVEVTDQEVLSSLKRDLIDKESIVSNERFEALQHKLRTLFRRPDLRFGVAAFQGDRVLMLNSDARINHRCIFADSVHRRLGDFAGTIYERATIQRRPLIIEDLTAYPGRTVTEDALLDGGVRNVIVAPLHYQGAPIGSLSLASPNPGDLNATHAPLLGEVLPLFAMAVKRSTDELDARIQSFIKEKCTAIHPVVEWRFRKAVLDGLEHGGMTAGAPNELEAIVFDNVHPLYALADIRGSSVQRARAIQADLLAQLGLARDVLTAAHDARPLPILDQLARRIDAHRAETEMSVRAGDEATVVEFLRKEIEPLFGHLAEFGPGVRARIDTYRGALDRELGMIYNRRKAFEDSVTRITDAISSYVDLEEQAAQGMFPHYFEKQKTDGVDYSLYVGGSLLEDGAFDPLYLRNLRLWQLMVACGIAMRVERLKDRLPIPLDTTSLILVQNAPLSIRFRFDEKRFDVDGAYNVRYEIIKKRIDKALIRGTEERLTQPGKIAIVYSHAAEASEYRHYIEYLQKLGHLNPEVEDLELAELQGADGLRALRVTVDLSHPEHDSTTPAAALVRAPATA
jgi:hypothetical protein